ncbi:MAG: hypothetical protein GOV02_01970 [Candidatus Aenigmarchaeota archaeon]|nr:hypothetical protein [Candidatus Aenigmarchaeota archaeon]
MKTEIKRQLLHGAGSLNVLGLITLGKEGMVGIILLSIVVATILSSLRGISKSKIWLFIEGFVISHERNDEKPLMGLLTFYTGMMLAIVLFPMKIAMLCIILLSVGDALSALVGKMIGKHKLPINKTKSWEGSITFFLSTISILLFAAIMPEKAIVMAVLLTMVEGLPRLDDNLTIPLAAGFMLLLF